MIKAFLANWGGAFRDGWGMARVLPWLVVAMVGIEFAQHIVEVQLGFFSADTAVRKAASLQPLRMAFGWPKMLVVYALGFFATRYFIAGDRREASRPSARAIARYAWVAGFQLIIAAVIIYAAPILGLFGAGGDDKITALRLVMGLGQQLAEPLLLLWFVNAAMGTHGCGPIASARTTRWLYLWALPLMFLTRLPFNAGHQLLNMKVAGQPPAILWPALALDAAVVGAMVVVLAAVQVRIARYIAARRGVALLWERAAP